MHVRSATTNQALGTAPAPAGGGTNPHGLSTARCTLHPTAPTTHPPTYPPDTLGTVTHTSDTLMPFTLAFAIWEQARRVASCMVTMMSPSPNRMQACRVVRVGRIVARRQVGASFGLQHTQISTQDCYEQSHSHPNLHSPGI
jgi:hypothetical protein